MAYTCKNFIKKPFICHLTVPAVFDTVEFDNPTNIPTKIAVNTDNVKLNLVKEEIELAQPIEVPDPCDPAKMIEVDTITVTEVKLSGSIAYCIGIDVLESSKNVTIEEHVGEHDVEFLTMPTTGFNTFKIPEEAIVLARQPEEDEKLEITVQAINVRVEHDKGYEDSSVVYELNGAFKIIVKIVPII